MMIYTRFFISFRLPVAVLIALLALPVICVRAASTTPMTSEHYLQHLLQRNPSLLRARMLLGRLYLEQGNAAAAEQAFFIASKHGANPSEILPLLGHALLAQGKAREFLERIKPPNPTPAALRARIALQYGQAHLMLEQFDAAVASFTEALKLRGLAGPARVGLAWVALARNDLDRATIEVNLAFAANNRHSTDVWLVKAELLRLRGQAAAAHAAFSKVLERDPHHLSARLGKAAMALAQHQPEAAAEDLRIASQAAPQHPLVERLQTLLADERDNLSSEKKLIKQIMTMDREPSSASLLDLGTLMAQEMTAGHHQAVLLAARRLQEQSPQLALGYATEGAIHLIRQAWDGADHALTAAYQREPSGLLALNIYIARSNNHNLGAEAVLADWFSRYPTDLEVQLAAAIALQQNRQLPLAQSYYEKVLVNQSDHLVALNNLALIYFDNRDPRALALAAKAYQLAPDNQQVLDTYQRILANQNLDSNP